MNDELKAANDNPINPAALMPLAQRGGSSAQYRLAMFYGSKDNPDYGQTLRWLRQASVNGHAVADYNLGYMYEFGIGTKSDLAKAATSYQRSGRRGYPNGLNNLGILYATGKGVKKDLAKAIAHWKEASNMGLGEASYNLAMMHMDPNGVLDDQEQFLFWINRAAGQGCRKALEWLEINAPATILAAG